ncbi:cytochrome P450 4C1-like, partial [Formica exsecta]|uniref:cytochrome P450 4C1-like n=1 Tax=Formica exsecta TaxID=72781 RepID=UPI001143AFD7
YSFIKLWFRGFMPWFYNDFLFSLSPQGRKQKNILKILHGFTEKVIAEGKLYHERTNGRYLKNLENDKETEIDVEVFGIKKKRLAMLDLLIAASQDNLLTDLDIREEVDTFMFAGHDTTAMSMTFALLLLAEHKDVQERVRVEVDTVMQENGGKLIMKSLQNLPYLDRCLKDAKWHARWKILTPAFHFNILNQFVDILIKENDCMTKSLNGVKETIVKDLASFIKHMLDAICETAMGISLRKLNEFQQQYQNAVHDIIELIFY